MSQSERLAAAARRRIIVGLALLLLFCGVAGQLLYSQLGSSTPAPRPMRMTASAASAPNLSRDQQRLERARVLRARWRGWALEHRAEIKAMLGASLRDQQALMAVWKKVPLGDYSPEGIRHQDLLPDGNVFSDVGYNWPAVERDLDPATVANPEWRKNTVAAKRAMNGRLKRDFASHRDFVISQSGSVGSVLSLWVSGRITEWEEAPRTERMKDQWAGTHRPIEPPYDFLQ